MGVREGDNLAGVARVGNDFLVPRERRIEDEFSRGDSRGGFVARRPTLEHFTVGKNDRSRATI